jgi:ABC-type multidrug transport system fused ATPase/permease subunit
MSSATSELTASKIIRPEGTFATIRRGLALTPQIYQGLWLTLLLIAVAATGRIVVPLSIQYALDQALVETADPDRVQQVITLAVGAGLLAVLIAGLASWQANRRLVRTSERALAQLRIRAFEHILQIAPARFTQEHRGSLVARVTSDVDTVAQFTQIGGVTLVANLAQMVAATGLMLVYSWPLTLIVLISCLPLVLGMRRIQQIVAERYGAVRRSIGALYSGVGEAVRGSEIIRAFGAAGPSQARTDLLIEEVRVDQQHTQWPLHFNNSLGELANGLVTAAVLVTGVLLGTADPVPLGLPAVSVGELVAFLFLVSFFVRPLQFSVAILGEAQSAVAGWRRVLEILDVPTGQVSEQDAVPLPVGGLDVELRRIGFGYTPERPALRDISVSIPVGAQVAVVGTTGAGKSTFAKLLTRQLDPDHGSLRLGGVELAAIAERALVRRVAIVPQDAFLFDRTVAENIALARPGATEQDVQAVLAALDLTDWAERLPAGLATRVGPRGEALSAGERQLVALARTALVDPDLLVLDEATSGIDPATDVRLHRALARLTRGRTTVTIAHRMITAETADTILLFHQGRLSEQGTHAELIAADGRYAGLHRAWTANLEGVK